MKHERSPDSSSGAGVTLLRRGLTSSSWPTGTAEASPPTLMRPDLRISASCGAR